MTSLHPPVSAPVSEFEAQPGRVVVHNPANTNAFSCLTDAPADDLEARFLFRAVPHRERFAREHGELVNALKAAGVEVLHLGDVAAAQHLDHLDRNPNHVYTRDSAIVLPWLPGHFIRAAMRKPIREDEPEVMAVGLGKLGLSELFSMPPGFFLEGGDVIPLERRGRRTLLVGYGPRTVRASLRLLSERLMPWAVDEIVGIELVPERMNLDGALVPVAADAMLVEPTSIAHSVLIDERGEHPVDVLRLLTEYGLEPIEVTRTEATTMQACNTVCLGHRVLIAYDLCDRVKSALEALRIDVRTIAGTELIKGTGGPRCMTRPLYD